jgi:threonine/homoserine/homoserine lactone efflux protein
MPLEQLLALGTLAIAGSFTPGPNNTIATVTGANHGFRAVVPHILGVPFGFSTMLIAGSLGAAALIAANPWLAALLKWGGVAYLLLIAWQMSRASMSTERASTRPLTFWQSALFQYANPKAWMIAVATVGALAEGGHGWPRTMLICAVFSACAVASLVLWAWVGVSLRGWLAVGRRLATFNGTMGALLAATALWMASQ